MRLLLPALLAISTPCVGADEAEQSGKKLPGSTLLPDGSQLQGVVIPKHNEQYQLENSLMADVVTLVNDEIIAGERVTIDFFGEGGKRSARIKLGEATFNQTAGMLRASEEVTLDAETYRARGTGLHYALRSNRGLLIGPATSLIQNSPKETAMNSKAPSLIAATGIALVSQTGDAAAQNPDGEANPEAVKVNTVKKNPVAEARQEARAELRKQLEATRTTDAEVREFVERVPLDYEELTGAPPPRPPAEPLEFEPGPNHTVVKCEGGMYFDAQQGHLVYLKEVRVDDPQYILTGADVLRVYMARKPEPAKKDGKDQPDKEADKLKPNKGEGDDEGEASDQEGPVPSLGGDFDSVEKIVATGAVRILQQSVQKGEQPVEASGAFFTYNPETGDITLSGGYPWVKQGDYYARAQQPNLTLYLKKDGSFTTEGRWEMGLPNKDRKPKDN